VYDKCTQDLANVRRNKSLPLRGKEAIKTVLVVLKLMKGNAERRRDRIEPLALNKRS